MLKNNLKGIIESEKLTKILTELNLNTQVRAENLSVSEWVKLSNYLNSGTEQTHTQKWWETIDLPAHLSRNYGNSTRFNIRGHFFV